jgi:hypothetical protein
MPAGWSGGAAEFTPMARSPSPAGLDDRGSRSKICGGQYARREGARQKGGCCVSDPLFDFRRPFDVARHPTLEPEVKRAMLASWASDARTVESEPTLRRPPGPGIPVPVKEVLAALRSLDQRPSSGRLQA